MHLCYTTTWDSGIGSKHLRRLLIFCRPLVVITNEGNQWARINSSAFRHLPHCISNRNYLNDYFFFYLKQRYMKKKKYYFTRVTQVSYCCGLASIVVHRASCVVCCPLTSSSQEILGRYLPKDEVPRPVWQAPVYMYLSVTKIFSFEIYMISSSFYVLHVS